MANGDRTVHARIGGTEIVRYDRAGKWYAEPHDGSTRTLLTLQGAANMVAADMDSQVFLRQPGGLRFDKQFTELRSALNMMDNPELRKAFGVKEGTP